MRFYLGLILCLFTTHASAVLMNIQEFTRLSETQQVMVLKAYKEFIAHQNSQELDPKFSSFSLSIIEKAYAAPTFDCFYAGWPSVKTQVTHNGTKKILCGSPSLNNPSYKSASASCKNTEMACNPTLFGTGLCVDISTQSKKNLAFSQCEKKFSSSGKELKDVAAEVSQNLAADAEDMFEMVNRTCSSGFQANSAMCSNLKSRIEKIKARKGDSPAQPSFVPQPIPKEETIAPSQVEVQAVQETTQSPIVFKPKPVIQEIPVIAMENPTPAVATQSTPTEQQALGEAVEQVIQLPKVVEAAGKVACLPEQILQYKTVLSPDQNVRPIYCQPVPGSRLDMSQVNVDQLIKDFNIDFHPSKEAVVKSPEFENFVHELRKFPAPLLAEMAKAGARIKLIIGDSVTDDPQWDADCKRKRDDAKKYQDHYNLTGYVEKVTQGCTSTFDGRTWKDDNIAGSGGFFHNKHLIEPTRIVINRLYSNVKTMPDGTKSNLLIGTANLLLHEHGHALDHFHGEKTISNSPQWKAVLNDPKVKAYLPKIFHSYEMNNPTEGFAEAFSYYHGCEASRKQMEEQAPALANFFKNFTSAKAFK